MIKYLPFLILLFSIISNCKNEDLSQKPKSKYKTDELSVQHGQEIFNTHCASCHNFEENGIGPNLTGVTTATDKDWLINFITNAPLVIKSGDKRATELFARYKQYMPLAPKLDGDEMEHLLGFIHKFSESQKKIKVPRPGGLIDPIKEKVALSDLTLVIEKVLTVPPSAETTPVARINKFQFIKTKKGERQFIQDLRGTLYEIKNDTTQVYFNLKAELPHFIDHPGLATGFGSYAFHPGFNRNGLLYTTHSEPPKTAAADFAIDDTIKTTLQWVVSEWKVKDSAGKVGFGKPREILRIDMHTGIHGLQDITFNPLASSKDADYGMLYLGIGDGGTALAGYSFLCDNRQHIWGSVIRINPLGSNSKNGKYGIPKDNPFVRDTDAVHEIWARGFRNPHFITWDQLGRIWITNIGQHSVEEINLGVAGADYGWPFREGTFLYDADANEGMVYPLPENDKGFTYPVIQYDHDEGNAVCSGFVYEGKKIPLLRGKYIFGDIPRGTLFYAHSNEIVPGQQAKIFQFSLEYNGEKSSLEEVTQNKRVDLRMGIDGSGEILLFSKSNGAVYKIINCLKAPTGEGQ